MIVADAKFHDDNGKGAECLCKITGNAELIAIEYATITKGLLQQKGGQAILDRAIDIIENKENNEHEEKGSK